MSGRDYDGGPDAGSRYGYREHRGHGGESDEGRARQFESTSATSTSSSPLSPVVPRTVPASDAHLSATGQTNASVSIEVPLTPTSEQDSSSGRSRHLSGERLLQLQQLAGPVRLASDTTCTQSASELTLKSRLPSKWNVPKDEVCVRRERNGLRLVRQVVSLSETTQETPSILVVANKPIPINLLHSVAFQRQLQWQARQQQGGDIQKAVNVYYFEVTIQQGATWVGLVPSKSIGGPVSPGRFPGDSVGSIGMSSDGQLLVSGRIGNQAAPIAMQQSPLASEKITIGCGLEVEAGTTSCATVFFTKNGQMFISPMEVPELDTRYDWYFPAVGLASASGDVFANFNGRAYAYRWKASAPHVLFSPLDVVPVKDNGVGVPIEQPSRHAESFPNVDPKPQGGSLQRIEGSLNVPVENGLQNDQCSNEQQFESLQGGNQHQPRQPDAGLQKKSPTKPPPPEKNMNITGPTLPLPDSLMWSSSTFESLQPDDHVHLPAASRPQIYGTKRSDGSTLLDEDDPESNLHCFPGSPFVMNGNSPAAPAPAHALDHHDVSVPAPDVGQIEAAKYVETSAAGRVGAHCVTAPAAGYGAAHYADKPASGRVGAQYVDTPAPAHALDHHDVIDRAPDAGRIEAAKYVDTSAAGRVGAHYVSTPAAGYGGAHYSDKPASHRVGAHYVDTPALSRPGAQYVDTPAPGRPGAAADGASVGLMRAKEITEATEDARHLEKCCRDNCDDISLIESLLNMCRSKQETVRRTLEESVIKFDDPTMQLPLDELMTLNFMLLEAVNMAETHLDGYRKPAPVKLPSVDVATGSLEIATLVNRQDVFSLICMLRAQGDVRLDAALALMRFARNAQRTRRAEEKDLRVEMVSSGGMHSLLALFRSKGATRELKVVAALAVAYLLPSFVMADVLPPSSIGLKIIQCLRFLFTSSSVTPQGEELSQAECRQASVTGVYTFWFWVLLPSLSTSNENPDPSSASRAQATRPSLRMRKSRILQNHPSGETVFDQRREVLESQELLELTVSLIVEMAATIDSTDASLQDPVASVSVIVQEMCAIDTARPIAVREGLLKVLVTWMRSHDGEKIRCAALSVNQLTSTRDSYMAGWIHSQIVNEGALMEIVKLSVSQNVGHDVRLAVAEILCSLCGAPHTRAAIVESKCVNCLISLLGDFQQAEKVAYAAGNALLQLAASAMARASVFSSANFEPEDSVSPDKRDDVISDVVNGGAINLFVTVARFSPRGKIRAMSVEAIRVLSEDTNRSRRARLQLCDDGAGEALGHIMKDNVNEGVIGIRAPTVEQDEHSTTNDLVPKKDTCIKELHQALCAWANILDRGDQTSTTLTLSPQTSGTHFEGDEAILVRGCIQFAEVGGLESLLRVATLPFKRRSVMDSLETVQELDLVLEACCCLASLSPLLLSPDAAAKGYATWSVVVLQALAAVLSNEGENGASELAIERKFDALRGIGALTKYEPHKLAIVDKFLPSLFHAKTARGDDLSYIAAAANHVCMSLGFSDDDLVKQIAGNDPKLMGDWFCMQRSLVLQSMARAEIKEALAAIWEKPFRDVIEEGLLPSGLRPVPSSDSGYLPGKREEVADISFEEPTGTQSEPEVELSILDEVFETLVPDADCFKLRSAILQQYHDVYDRDAINRGGRFTSETIRSYNLHEGEASSLLSSHVYPLNSISTEREWMLSHRTFMDETTGDSFQPPSCFVTDHVQALMDSCIPSRLIQLDVLPIFDLKPESLFDFRSVLMPQRRYFSFRREGQLVSQLCDTNAACIESEGDIYWTLGFTNSTFAGEFSETLVQALYRCPMVRGISFTRNKHWQQVWATGIEDEGKDFTGLLANLAGSLPPWISSITYDNTLNDFALRALSAILETMGRLSAGQADCKVHDGKEFEKLGQKQGSFQSFAVRNSPNLSLAAWTTFIDLLGASTKQAPSLKTHPLSTLRVLDLSGNELGDNACSLVLSRVLDKSSGCCLEQLDLSRNAIRDGVNVQKVLRQYVSQYRTNQSAGTYVNKSSWKTRLSSLNIGSNELHQGGLAVEVCVLLKYNALSLKSLDLSNNGLEYKECEVLLGSLVKNTVLRHLNLSRNAFSVQYISGLLDGLNRSDSDTGLAFLRLDENCPPLTEHQRNLLNSFVNASKKTCLQRYLCDRARIKSGEVPDPDTIDDGPQGHPPEIYDDDPSIFSGSDAPISVASDGGSSLRIGENLITVLFSAPLVFQDEQSNYKPFAKLDFDMERDLLWQCLKDARRDIELKFDNATSDQLLEAKTKRCSCLHYSGHGHTSHLPFENGKGGPHWLEVKLLRELIQRNDGPPFKFVFVSACHSELAGATFASAGVPHVVCCRQESEVKDTAALAFTRHFYLALAVGHTVKESFEQGCKAVRATPNLKNAEEQMKQYILLPKDGDHNVSIFVDAKQLREWPRPSGSTRTLQRTKSRRKGFRQESRSKSIYGGGARMSELSVRNMMQEDPSPTPPQFFIGREVDMYNLLNLVLSYRLVSVVGEKGVGRSSVVYGLCHYINERKSTIQKIDRILFVKATQNRGSNRFVTVLRELLRKTIQEFEAAQSQIELLDREQLVGAIYRGLNGVKALVVIDRTEFLEGSDEQQDLVLFLSNLFQDSRTQKVRVLLTGRQSLGIVSIGGVPEQPYTLGPLNFDDTIRLFGNLCPHLHTAGDRRKFVLRLVLDEKEADMLPTDESASHRTKELFQAIGDGIPSKIEKAAYSISSDDLHRLGLPLNFRDTVRLFGFLCPHFKTDSDCQEFVLRLVADEKEAEMLPTDEIPSHRMRELFRAIGDGIPSKIEKAAYSITSDDLHRLGFEHA